MELAWTSVWVHGITIRVDFVYNWVSGSACMCVSAYVCLCFLIMLLLTVPARFISFAFFYGCFVVALSILAFFIITLFWSRP